MQVSPGCSQSELFNRFTICHHRSVDEARETYERLVEIFPTCGRYWKLYIEQEVTIIYKYLIYSRKHQTDSRACLHEVGIHDLIHSIVVSFVLFPLQIRAGKFENVEKVNKSVNLTAKPTYFIQIRAANSIVFSNSDLRFQQIVTQFSFIRKSEIFI